MTDDAMDLLPGIRAPDRDTSVDNDLGRAREMERSLCVGIIGRGVDQQRVLLPVVPSGECSTWAQRASKLPRLRSGFC